MSDLATKAVLVVEDDPRNAQLVSVMLNIVGVTCIQICATGRDISDVAGQMPTIDLVLLDLQLPGEDGYQIFKRLSADPLFTNSRIVAVTAQVTLDDVDRADKAGFGGFLGKPLNFDRFPFQIKRLLDGERVWEPR